MPSFSRKDFLKVSGLAAAGLLAGFRLENRFSIIIRNGAVYDGAGTLPVMTDVGIKDGVIKALGDLSSATADLVVDASGKAVSPGFIDIHTHTDVELLVQPPGDSKLFQGVTTEVGGNCGAAPHPMTKEEAERRSKRLKEEYGLDFYWENLDGFLDAMDSNGLGLNFATLSGHGSLRAHVVGRYDVEPTAEQLKRFKALLAEEMEMGSFGLSSGLEYSPGSYAKTGELIELSKVVRDMGGIYATHMRNEDDTVEEALAEAIEISRKSGAPLQVSHLKACNPANWHKVDNLLAMIQSAIDEGLPVYADRYPYTAWGTGLSTLVPVWARQGNADEQVERLKDPALQDSIKAYAESRGSRIGGWDRFQISSTGREENKQFEGKTIQDCCELTSKEPYEFVRDLLIEEKMGTGIVGFAMEENNLRKVLQAPFVFVASDGSVAAPEGPLSGGKPHPRYYGTFTRVLGKFVREENFFPLETAVKKMTSMPAEKMGLNDRGTIAKGKAADVVVFDPATVGDNATFTDPHRLSSGIDYVIVNGVASIAEGKLTGALPGRALRRQG